MPPAPLTDQQLRAAATKAAWLEQHVREKCASRGADGGSSLRASGRSHTGITKLAALTFFPRYCYERSHPRDKVGRGSKGGKGARRGAGKGGSRAGLARGTRVDVELRAYTQLARTRLAAAAARGASAWGKNHSIRSLLRPQAGSHPFTAKIASGMQLMGLHPVLAQVAVEDSMTRIGTACDLVCVDACDASVVVVEIKCGFDGYFDASCGGMLHEPGRAGCTDAPRFQHQVQLALTAALFERTYGLAPRRSYILRASADGVYFYKLRRDLLGIAPSMLLRMATERDRARQ